MPFSCVWDTKQILTTDVSVSWL